MHITVVCPGCGEKYQLDPSVLGKVMRCPQAHCRTAFEVRAPAAPAPAKAPVSGSVGDIVPILAAPDLVPLLPAEPAYVSPPEPAQPSPSWQDTPPLPRRSSPGRSARIIREPAPEAEAPAPKPQQPGHPAAHAAGSPAAPDWQSAPPPARRASGPAPAAPPPAAETPPAPGPKTERRKAPKAQRPSTLPGVQTPLPTPGPRAEQKAVPPPPPTPPGANAPCSPERNAPGSPERNAPGSPEGNAPGSPVPEKPSLADLPVELPPGAWEPPPVRRGRAGAAEHEPAPEEVVPHAAPAKRRRASLYMIGIVGVFLLVIGVAVAGAWVVISGAEGRLARSAKRDYDEKLFASAAGKYQQLLEKFPESADADDYQFMQELSELRAEVAAVPGDVPTSLDELEKFLKHRAQDPRFSEHAPDVGHDLVAQLRRYADDLAGSPDVAGRPVLARAERLIEQLGQSVPAADRQKLAESFAAAREAVARAERRKAALARLDQLPARADGIKAALQILKEEGLEQDPDASDRLNKLFEGHAASVTYTEDPAELTRGRRGEDTEPSLVISAPVGPRHSRDDDDPVVLALARGVLYGLHASSGDIRWALRVGIDTANLPVRVPRTPSDPEMFLVLSADTETLIALDSGGEQLWRYRLSGPCLGRPTVIGRRAYVPTYDGQVHEIELARGHLLGRWNLGQRLTVGGARQEGTGLVYFPADDFCVYVLDVERKRCQAVLYSGHPAGSLRCEPIVAAGRDPAMPSFLILAQTEGLDALHLRTFALPIQDRHAKPLAMQPEPRLRGWSWFAPYHDLENVVLVTDAGKLGLFGIRQARNQDNPLFPRVPPQAGSGELGVDLDSLLPPEGAARSRAQIAHAAAEDNFWVLANGKLGRLEVLFTDAAGPQVFPAREWAQPLPLGSPLHAAQAFEHDFDGPGSKNVTLLLVTQAPGRQACLATAVDAESGKVRWQRQLGVVCRGAPLALGGEVLAHDQGGGLLPFGSSQYERQPGWLSGGRLAGAGLDDGPGQPPVLLPGPDGLTAYQIATPGKGGSIVIRRYQAGRDKERGAVKEFPPIELGAGVTLAGTPAVGEGGILLPLSDGSILKVPLEGGRPAEGPAWRRDNLNPDLRTHLVWLSADEFVATDGGRGLNRWRWPAGQSWSALPKDKPDREPSKELPARIVSAPAVLPGGHGLAELCVADADGVVHLLRAKGEALDVVRSWPVKGRVTAGPFVRGRHIGCVVDRRRLVWIDPNKAEPVWDYKAAEAIVGEPQLAGGVVLVADQGGHFVGIDPAAGRPRSPGYTLKANVAPAAAPVGFGAKQVFAPLADGTVLLLSLDRLRDPLWGVPAGW
ncbi:MAG TPA: PQQ-binding-like beta-propeller repeat protein [Gemmataceae bacterium]|nr:PQQ-binding-like beta-propeller repeat protein [Gemmataceae bacterium]